MNKILIPLIRNIVPKLIAQDIVGVQPMTASTAQVFSWHGEDTKDRIITGEDFTYKQPYWVQPELGGLFSKRYDRYQEINDWCNKTFGASTEAWNNPRWSASNRKYWFKYEKDRMLFVLRWS